MINEDTIERLKEKNYSLKLENEKLKIMNAKQEKVIKNIHAILRQLSYK
ncbi:hypothetical protein LGL55_05675 [Clostridium tagluense]|nr:hypothetical protein [Clostridium tagluense]MCB2310611.1 hypothetical protein [Clostridium tagluense]MCB2315658.1 hypothetical protein [Clostridium tagluense]MCB2320512.1 hypothetical protein [Clostridium tagluense]MCB2325205.1 hypothetical protein [Clostridium tagluense]MCB2330057.1 hypothetical protein [Clostridium tagluense]